MFSIMIKSLFEFGMIVLLLYGYAHEKELIEIEQMIKKLIVLRYRIYRRNKRAAEMRRNREFKVVDGRSAKGGSPESLHVA